ncbi:MAG TPA: PAS domain-containing sensor histidine kinase [Vicinamibacterales bacterium]|nr:PAS domain-containing sensor histidine kinase [Vicinamibacterales bacterium]
MGVDETQMNAEQIAIPGVKSARERASELFAAARRDIYRQTDRLFAALMVLQWIGGILFALWVSPLAWAGTASSTHLHVWAAVLLGGVISLFPAALAALRPGLPSTRYTIAIAQMLMGALLIHLTGGRIETHFHVFGSLAFLACYRDWRVLVPATVVVALDHMLRGVFWPQSVYGVLVASQWRWVEHAAWVIFEDIILLFAIRQSVVEMQETADRTAALEHEVRTRQQAEMDARNSQARNDAILDVALDCVILMDQTGRIVQFNPAAEQTFGYTSREAVGLHLSELIIPSHQPETDRGSLARFLETGDASVMNARLELTAVRKNGEAFPVEVAIAPISADGSAMIAGYMRDITERRSNEAELAAYTRDLEVAHETQRENSEQLAALVAQLRLTQRRAEDATRAKSDFLASMSHELRTPLNAIILYSELLQEQAEDEGEQRAESIADLQKIQSAGKHLLELINGILDLSKIEAGKMALSRDSFDVQEMIEELLDTVGPLVRKNNNVLSVNYGDHLGMMHSDLMKTRQILLNLLSNAGKFTRNGEVTVSVVRRTENGAALVEFTVTDTGVGMTEAQSQKVFDAFTQADVTTTRKYGGTGLGLALVSRFCDLMHGSVSVVSRPGVGSRFTVRLPLEAAVVDVPETVAVG